MDNRKPNTMKILFGIMLALVLMSSCAMSQSLLTTMNRNGMWYLSLGGTDKLVYIMGVVDGSNVSTNDISIDQIKVGLDEFFSDTKNVSTISIVDALPIVIEKLKSETN